MALSLALVDFLTVNLVQCGFGDPSLDSVPGYTGLVPSSFELSLLYDLQAARGAPLKYLHMDARSHVL